MKIDKLLLTEAQILQAETAWGICGLPISRDGAICRAQVAKMVKAGAVVRGANDDDLPGMEVNGNPNDPYYRGFMDGYNKGKEVMLWAGFRKTEEIEL